MLLRKLAAALFHGSPKRLGVLQPREDLSKCSAANIAAYIIGPSGAGKTTYVKRHYPTKDYFILHSDKYAIKKPDGKVSIDWERGLRDGQASGKPIVIDAYHINRKLMAAAVDKVLLDPGKVRTTAQLIARRKGSSKRRPWKLTPEEKLESFNRNARPLAEELGFKTKTATIRSLAHILTRR